MKQNTIEKRVYYADTDAGGIVYYANYLKWFEIGRTELLREQGIVWSELQDSGFMAPVVHVECDYLKPAKNNDIVLINTSIENVGNSSIKFNYEIKRKKDNELLVKGHTVNVFIDKKEMKSIPIPDHIRNKLI